LPNTEVVTSTVRPPRFRRAQLATAIYFLVNGSVVGAWVPHIPGRARALHLNTAQLGAVLLSSGFGAVLAMPAASRLIARFGSRPVTRAAAALFPLALAAVVFAPSPTLLAFALLSFGLTGSTMDVSMNAQAIAVETGLGRRTISLLHGMWSLGAFLGAALTSTLLAHRIPSSPLTLATAAGLLAAAAAAGPLLLPHCDQDHAPRAHALRPRGRLLLLGLLVFIAMICEGSIADWSAIYLRTVRHLPTGINGYGYTAFAAAMVLGRLSGDRLVERTGERGALLFGGLTAAAGLAVVLTLPSLPASLAGFSLVGIGLANSSPVLYRTAGRVPGVPPGAGIATAVGLGYTGFLAGPPALGFLGHHAGISSIFLAILSLSLLLAAASPIVKVALPSHSSSSPPHP
jgi:MFS family permease